MNEFKITHGTAEFYYAPHYFVFKQYTGLFGKLRWNHVGTFESEGEAMAFIKETSRFPKYISVRNSAVINQ